MKRPIISVFFLLLLVAASVVSAYAQKPKLAVLVVGLETDAASDAFAAALGYDVTQKGLVTAADNNAVATKLTALRLQYAQGEKVDTVGLTAWGKKTG